jgi:hypothetical protein
LERELQSAKARIEELNGQANHWKSAADNFSSQLQTVYASRSWRITRPLRSAFCLLPRSLKKLSRIPQSIQQRALQLRSSALATMIRFAVDHPRFRAKVQPLVRRVPSLESMLHESTLSRGQEAGTQIPSQESLHISNLSLHSRNIYADLKVAIEQNRGRN